MIARRAPPLVSSLFDTSGGAFYHVKQALLFETEVALVQAHSQAYGHPDGVRNVTQLALWVLAWVATLALARFGPSQLWDSQSIVSWAAIVVNVAVGVGLIVVHARYLQNVDELQRKILLDAMAVTLGVGLVAGCAYGVAANTDLIGRDADIAYLIMLMGIVYAVASLAGNIRYR